MNCHTQTILCIGLMAMGVILTGGAVYAECKGVPTTNMMSNGITAIITGAFGFMRSPRERPDPELPPPPGTKITSETKETVSSETPAKP